MPVYGYYGVLTFSVILFGLQFFFNERYQKESGSGIGATFLFALLYSLAGGILMLIINKFQCSATPFTLILALITAISSFLYIFCSLKALDHINLSLFTLFTMLGGMLVPFVVGMVFYEEPRTVAKTVCLVLLVIALLLTVEKGEKKNGFVYYAGVFFLNGLAGVYSLYFQKAPYEKTDEASFTIWKTVFTAAIACVVLLILFKKVKKPTKKAVGYAAGFGAINTIANYLLLLALAVLSASVQYPFVTGGTMIVTAVIGFICGQKPSKREILSIAVSFIGILALVLIPV